MFNTEGTIIDFVNDNHKGLYDKLVNSMHRKELEFIFSEDELDIIVSLFHRAYEFEVESNDLGTALFKMRQEIRKGLS